MVDASANVRNPKKQIEAVGGATCGGSLFCSSSSMYWCRTRVQFSVENNTEGRNILE